MVVQLRRMAFINKNIAPEGWTFAPLISVSSVGTPLFISFLGFTYIELQMDKLLSKSECRFYLDGMTLNQKQIFFPKITSLVELFYVTGRTFFVGYLEKRSVFVFSHISKNLWTERVANSIFSANFTLISEK